MTLNLAEMSVMKSRSSVPYRANLFKTVGAVEIYFLSFIMQLEYGYSSKRKLKNKYHQ